jgi:PAS domain S-box-containing protein
VGSYANAGQTWRYASQPVAGTPWTLSATVGEDVLFAPAAGDQTAGRAGLAAAAAVGLLVVGAVARARRNRRDLQLSEQRFRKVFDNSRIGMLLTAPDGRFLRVNPALCQILGRSDQQLLGSPLATIAHPDDAHVGVDQVRDCLVGRIDGFDADKRYLHADGHTIEAAVTTALMRDGSGQAQYFATQIIDVTERRALERARQRNEAQLAERAEQLQQANAQMADFLAMLTHDVRQPLTSVVAAGELMLADWADMPDDDKHHYVQRMIIAGHRASSLVGEILTLAQLDAGALVAHPIRLDVAHAVREAVAVHDAPADQPITVMAPDECTALADAAHLQLILGNLLGNATKYGAPPVTITVANDPDHVRIRVSDHGEGVPDTFAPYLFDRFSRADSGVAVTKAGTGLGLYFVRQLADASGLSIDYQTNQPHGAVFTLALPHAAAITTPAHSTHIRAPSP